MLKTLRVKPGDRLPPSKPALEERLESIDGVVRAHVEAVCCEEGGAILYVGIEEKGSPHFDYRSAPEGDVRLPEEIAQHYAKFLEAVANAGHAGKTAEDLTQGHSLMAAADVREIQEGFVLQAAKKPYIK